MKKFLLTGSRDVSLLFLRIAAGGFMFFSHGLGKALKFDTMLHSFANPIGIGPVASFILNVGAEFICSLLLIFGLFTRLAAIPLMINMAVIVLFVHLHDPWMRKEFALLYFIAFSAILLGGPGKFSLDNLLFRQEKSVEVKHIKKPGRIVSEVS